MIRKRLLPIAFLVVLGFGFWYAFAPSRTPAPQPPLTKLTEQDFSQFKSAFDRDPSSVRLILLLSPT